MTLDKNAPPPNDALLARYHAAQSTLDTMDDGVEALKPSAQTRMNILNYAAKFATDSGAARADKERADSAFHKVNLPANDSQWKIRALATIAVFGISSLLLLQWERGTPEEKDAAFGTARLPSAAPAPQAPLQATPQVAPTPAHDKTTAPKPAPPPTRTHTQPAPVLAEAAANPAAATAASLPSKPEQAGAQAPLPATAPSVPPTLADAPASAIPAAPAMAPAQTTPAQRAAPAAKALGQNAVPSERATTGRTASHQALFNAISQADATALQQALAKGADKNAKSNGTPAITLCVQSGQLNLVQILITAGADVNAPDAQGITPLAHARTWGFDAIANALVGAGAN
jgi:hypothetical protein